MYGKLFASMYQGTLRGRAHELLVFTNLISCCDRSGFVDKHFKAIADEVGLSVDEVKTAIKNLESPDPESRTPNEQGARIKRVDDHRAWGWTVVNYIKYREIRHSEDRREQNRKAQSAYRKRNKPESANGNQESAESAHAEVDAPKHLPPTPKTNRTTSMVAVAPSALEAPGAPAPKPPRADGLIDFIPDPQGRDIIKTPEGQDWRQNPMDYRHSFA